MKNIIVLVTIAIGILFGSEGLAQSVADYLILQDIGQYKLSIPEKMIPGFAPIGGPRTFDGAGVVAGTGHFTDHVDKSYEVMYLGGDANASPTVQVTQHAGSDSDKWLLHEMDSAFRDKFGIPAVSYYPWQVDGHNIVIDAVGGREYRWLSGNKIVTIEYHGSIVSTPEPIEVVKAYLAKHPSTIPAMTLSQLRSTDNKTKWLKDEMDRRLWFAQIQTSDSKLGDKLKSTTDSMVVFLNYREKYYGITSKNDKIALETALFQNNVTGVQTKLTEYKTWWTEHKVDPIALP